jgi:hypothetical protein
MLADFGHDIGRIIASDTAEWWTTGPTQRGHGGGDTTNSPPPTELDSSWPASSNGTKSDASSLCQVSVQVARMSPSCDCTEHSHLCCSGAADYCAECWASRCHPGGATARSPSAIRSVNPARSSSRPATRHSPCSGNDSRAEATEALQQAASPAAWIPPNFRGLTWKRMFSTRPS